MKRLAFIANRVQWAALQETFSGPPDCAVASLDPEVMWELQGGGVEVVSLHDYVDGGELEANAKAAWTMCDECATVLRGMVMFGGCDLIERTRNDLFMVFFAVLNHNMMVERVLRATGAREVVHFSEMRNVVWWDPPDPPPDVFNATVAWVAELKGCATRSLALKADSGENEANPNPVSTREPERQPVLSQTLPADVSTIAYCPWITYREQELLLENVAARGLKDWLLVTDYNPIVPLPRLTPRQLMSLPFDTQTVVQQLRELDSEGFVMRLRHAEHKAWQLVCENEFLGCVWSSYREWLAQVARMYAAGRFLSATLEPKLLVMRYDNGGAERCFQQAFLDSNVPVISVDHIGLSVSGVQRRNAGGRGHAAVWGEHDARGHAGHRKSASRVKTIGSLRSDLSVAPGQGAENAGCTIAILTSRVATFWGPTVDLKRLGKTWAGILAVCRRHPAWQFLLKPHPRYDHHQLYQSEEFRGIENLRVLKGDESAVLSGVNVAVLMNCRSTVIIEAIRMRVPVVYLKDASWQNDYFRSVIEDGGAVVARSVEELESVLDRILSDTAYRESVLAAAASFLPSVLCATGDEAVQNMWELIEEVSLPVAPGERRASSWRPVFDLLVEWNAIPLDKNPYRWLRSRVRMRRLPDDIEESLCVEGWPMLAEGLWRKFVMRKRRLGRSGLRLADVVGYVFGLPVCLRPPAGALRNGLSAVFCEKASASAQGRAMRLVWKICASILAPGGV